MMSDIWTRAKSKSKVQAKGKSRTKFKSKVQAKGKSRTKFKSKVQKVTNQKELN